MGAFRHQPLFFAGVLLLAFLLLHEAGWLAASRLGSTIRHGRRHLRSSALRHRTQSLRASLWSRFPRLSTWAAARVDPKAFTGLPLTLIILALGYVAFLIGGMVEELLEAEEIIHFDRAVDRWLSPYREEPLIDIFVWITDLGGSATLVGIAFVTTGFLWAHRRTYLIPPIWIAIIGAETTTWLGKWVFDRGRPESIITAIAPLSASFPSGHATGAMAVYGFVAYAMAVSLPGLRERFEITYWALVLILLIGLSRVFLSVHYASDVVTGWLVGFFWLLVGVTAAERHSRRR